MEKFGRTYQIVFRIGHLVQVGAYDEAVVEEELVVEYPLTADFAVSRSVYSQVNTAFVTIYGLNQRTREKIYKDRYDMIKYITMDIYAGYDDFNSLIFSGTVKECQSFKDSGATEFQTFIEGWDGGLAVYYGEDNNSFSAGTSYDTILETLTGNMPNVRLGAISPDFENETALRPVLFTKKTYDDLQTLTDGNIFIDNEYVYFLKDRDVLQGEIEILDVDSGLLGSPQRRDTIIDVNVVFEPRLMVGQQILLQSKTVPYLNGFYKVLGVSHDGTISGSKSGSMITNVSLFIGTELFRMVERKNA